MKLQIYRTSDAGITYLAKDDCNHLLDDGTMHNTFETELEEYKGDPPHSNAHLITTKDLAYYIIEIETLEELYHTIYGEIVITDADECITEHDQSIKLAIEIYDDYRE